MLHRIIGLAFLLLLSEIAVFALTFANNYPFVQKSENGKVQVRSVPFRANGPYSPGETFVYSNGKLLYKIDKYFQSQFFTTENGKFLIEIDFGVNNSLRMKEIGRYDDEIAAPIDYKGEVVRIYKNGLPYKSVKFSQLQIDTSTIRTDRLNNWFSWYYKISKFSTDDLEIKMNKHPAFIENDRLYLITTDNQLIEIEIEKAEVISRAKAYETLKQRNDWTPLVYEKEYQYVKYPKSFEYPNLRNGKTFNNGFKKLLSKSPYGGSGDTVISSVYFVYFLLNKNGKCEEVSFKLDGHDVDRKKWIPHFKNAQLEADITNWTKKQRFDTKLIPKGFNKFNFHFYFNVREDSE